MFVLNVAVVKRYVELKIVDLIYIMYIMCVYIYISKRNCRNANVNNKE